MKTLRRSAKSRKNDKSKLSGESKISDDISKLSGESKISGNKGRGDVRDKNKLVATHQIHEFSFDDANKFASRLLKWYGNAKRDLPWRSLSNNLSSSDRAYAVLVSEVMLQQTQVVTVLQYYSKWMARWPTFSALAQASLDDVYKVWAGMGYYSRAKRLWEASKKVTFELEGKVPETSQELQENLPGVGRYTSGAVASIAFGERIPAVDGNVVRVLSRVRCIGADCASKVVTEHIWKISNQIVSREQPGDFNQAMMDLGATICTPKKPSCDKCPVSQSCLAYQRVRDSNPLKELHFGTPNQPEDIEDEPCCLCLSEPWDYNLGVMNFPRKSKKAPPRNETSLVCILFKKDVNNAQKFLLSQTPAGGLLGGLWEFPSMPLSGPRFEDVTEELLLLKKEVLMGLWDVEENSILPPSFVGVVRHIFSHIHKSYVIYCTELISSNDVVNKQGVEMRWMTADEVGTSAISTAMKKVFSAFSNRKVTTHTAKKRSRSVSNASTEMGAKKVTDYFSRISKQ